jgi:hypothetical protein
MTIVADALDVEQTSIGFEADLPQCGQVLQLLADTEIARVVDGGLGAQGPLLLVVLLDPRMLVVDVKRRSDAFGDDAGSESARGALGHAPVEDELDLASPQ